MIQPDASFRLSNQTALSDEYTCNVGETFYIIPTGDAEFKTLYEGTTGKIWQDTTTSAGVFFDVADSLPVTYSLAGDYKLTLVASSAGSKGNEYKQVFKTVLIHAVDNRAAMTSYSVVLSGIEYKGVISGDNSISIAVPNTTANSTLLQSVKPFFNTLSPDAKVFVNETQQQSGITEQNLLNTIQYKVVAVTGDIETYSVSISFYAPSDEKKITQFTLITGGAYGNGENATIDEELKSISVVLNYATPANKAKVIINTSPNSTYLYNGTSIFGTYTNLTTAGTSPVPLTYIKVVAQDGSESTYSVSAQSENPFLTFSFVGLTPEPITTIDTVNKTIVLKVLKGTDLTSLVAKWTGTLGKVTVDGVKQVNGTTANNFSSAKQYKLYKGTSTTVTDTYTVTVITLE